MPFISSQHRHQYHHHHQCHQVEQEEEEEQLTPRPLNTANVSYTCEQTRALKARRIQSFSSHAWAIYIGPSRLSPAGVSYMSSSTARAQTDTSPGLANLIDLSVECTRTRNTRHWPRRQKLSSLLDFSSFFSSSLASLLETSFWPVYRLACRVHWRTLILPITLSLSLSLSVQSPISVWLLRHRCEALCDTWRDSGARPSQSLSHEGLVDDDDRREPLRSLRSCCSTSFIGRREREGKEVGNDIEWTKDQLDD